MVGWLNIPIETNINGKLTQVPFAATYWQIYTQKQEYVETQNYDDNMICKVLNKRMQYEKEVIFYFCIF